MRDRANAPVVWALMLANAGTLMCLLAGRGHLAIAGCGAALALTGVFLTLRDLTGRRRGGHPPTKVL